MFFEQLILDDLHEIRPWANYEHGNKLTVAVEGALLLKVELS